MTENENGARPPDPEQWPESGPTKIQHKLENMLSNGQSFGLGKLAEICGGESKSAYSQTSRAVSQMVADGLIVSLENPDDRKQKIFRWSFFEAQDPTPLGPEIGDFMSADPSVLIEPANPRGYRCRAAFRWKRIRGTKLREELPAGIEKMSDDELLILLEDVCEHQGNQAIHMTGPGQKRPGNVSGFELLGWVSSRGFGAGARGSVTRWIGQTADQRPLALWLPECILASANKGYRLHPLVSANVRMVSALPGMIHPPESCWGAPREIVRELAAEAASIWRTRSFVGS